MGRPPRQRSGSTAAAFRRPRRLAVLLGTAALIIAPLTATAAPRTDVATRSANGSANGSDRPGTYLVLLRSAPLATYDGDVSGFARTAPRLGQRFDADRPAVNAYESHLLAEQSHVLSQLGSPPVLYRYTTALNGFAATLSADQVATMRKHPDLLTLERSKIEHVAGASSEGLGRDGDHGVWQSIGGPAQAGKGVVVGLVDSGIWPENPSFAGVPLDRATLRATYPGFTGSCQLGERWSATSCDAKVIAARAFLAGFGSSHLAAAEFASPRDGSGHGSHTAAIAAGNAGVDVSIDGQRFGHVAGVAPAAGIAVYKACWAAPDPANDGCATPDTAKAVDQAVRDGVDVLNYSVTGHRNSLTDVIGQAFLNAASSGVFVSAAAGDDGPEPGTVGHSGPWVTTVAASRTDAYQGGVVLGNGDRFMGAMVSNTSIRHAPLLYARDVLADDASPRQAAHCFPGSLDASKVDGSIVVCDRGINGRVTKSQTVRQAGGAAMILVNETHGSTDADLHAVPTVHVTASDGKTILQYVEKAAHPTATLDAERERRLRPAVADVSSRGPAKVAGGDILKPDLTAPGVSVLAAVAPPSNFGHLWDLYSGTSMAAPAVAGLAAIVTAAHPAWTPAMTKSALMTTAEQIGDRRLPLEQGAGEVDPTSVLDPGLVYDAGRDDWLGYLSGIDRTDGAPTVSARRIDAVDVNAPSIAIGSLVGEETVTRTVTNVSSGTETYTARVDGLGGVAVSVSRPSFTLRPGKSVTFDVTFSARRTARYQHVAHGALILTGSRGHTATSPIVARPELVDAPPELTGAETTGSIRLKTKAGVTGTIDASSSGLVGAAPTGFVLTPGAFDPQDPETDASTQGTAFEVPDDTAVARFEVRTASPGDDLDLHVYRDDKLVASADDEGDGLVTLDRPEAGIYTAYVHASAETGDVTLGSLTGWVIRDDQEDPAVAGEDAEPLTIGPSPVAVSGGRAFRLDVSWRRLDASKRWLAVVDFEGSNRRTFVTVN